MNHGITGEYLFGTHKGKLSTRETARRHRICREEGGYGYTQIDNSHGTALPNGDWIGWFSGPNRGEPFNSDLAQRVMDRVQKSVTRGE
jgi:hypothetical protein